VWVPRKWHSSAHAADHPTGFMPHHIRATADGPNGAGGRRRSLEPAVQPARDRAAASQAFPRKRFRNVEVVGSSPITSTLEKCVAYLRREYVGYRRWECRRFRRGRGYVGTPQDAA
jgi:hypothetical protein